jgi:hypothetical protein
MRYYLLEFDFAPNISVLSKNGGTLYIEFPDTPGEIPWARFTPAGGSPSEITIFRAGSARPDTDAFFFNTAYLRNTSNSNVNLDVAGGITSPTFSYVSMYIVAVGQNYENFTRIYGKPTRISIFQLTDRN